MRKLNRPAVKWRDVVFWFLAVLIVAGDQLTKLWIRSNLALGQSLPGTEFPRIIHIQNTGAAFGIFKGYTFALTIASIIASIIILCYVLFLHRRFPDRDTMFGECTLGVIMGGVVGNLIERLRFSYVPDFIDFGFWPAFNVADSAVSVGVALLVINILLLARTLDAEK